MTDDLLTPDEWRFYTRHGQTRHDRVVARGLHAEYGENNTSAHNHVLGAGGEYVIARRLGIVWPTDTGPDGHQPDVGGWHVRTSEGAARLILRDCDPDGLYVAVARIHYMRFRICGWCDTTTIDRTRHLATPDRTRPPCALIPMRLWTPWEQRPSLV